MQSLNDTLSVIDLSLSHPIVQMPEEKGHKKMIVVNPLNHRNLMDMCSKFGEIRALLGLLHTLHKEELVELIFKTEWNCKQFFTQSHDSYYSFSSTDYFATLLDLLLV